VRFGVPQLGAEWIASRAGSYKSVLRVTHMEMTMERYGTVGDGSFCLDPEAGVNALLNDATELLQYARGITELLLESLEEDEIPERQRTLLALGGVGALITMGVQCAAQAHAKMEWDKV
jgi:hypothetical protein